MEYEDRENLKTSSRWDCEYTKDGRAELYERRTETWVENCPFCNHPVTVRQETEEWEETSTNSGHWEHSNFGITDGYCEPCDLVLIDTFDGLVYFRLNE